MKLAQNILVGFIKCMVKIVTSLSYGGSGRFRNGVGGLGGAVPSRCNCLGLGIVLMPLYTYPMRFCESREQNTHCKHCMLITIRVMRVLQLNFSKNKPFNKCQTGGARSMLRLQIHLCDFYSCKKNTETTDYKIQMYIE